MAKKIIFLFMFVFLISLASGLTIKQQQSYDLTISCEGFTCSSMNITILYPNSTKFVDNQQMTDNTYFANYTITPDALGEYIAYYYDGTNQTTSTFIVNTVGEELTTGKSLVYIGGLLVLVFLFIVNVGTIPLLPTKDETNDVGDIIKVSKLKHLRMFLYATAWIILLAIMFVGSNIAVAFLQTELIGKILFNFWQIGMWISIIALPIFFIGILLSIFRDKETKRMLERIGDTGYPTP